MIDYESFNFSNKKISNYQRRIIFNQLFNFCNLQNSSYKNLHYKKDTNGNLILPQGALIHGTGATLNKTKFLTEEQLNSMSKHGIIAPEFLGSYEKFDETYYCADFFKVEDEQTLHEYSKTHREIVKDNTKQIAPECNYLPILSPKDRIAFIILPNKNEHFQKLLEFDIYKNNTNHKFMESIIGNISYIYNFELSTRLSSILVGLPPNVISGIWISKNLIKPDILQNLHQKFQDCFIVDNLGKLIVEPHPEYSTTITEYNLQK